MRSLRILAVCVLVFWWTFLPTDSASATDAWESVVNGNVSGNSIQFDYRGGSASYITTVSDGSTVSVAINNTIANCIGSCTPIADSWNVSINGQSFSGNAIEATSVSAVVSGQVTINVSGIDNGFWAGWYGPIFTVSVSSPAPAPTPTPTPSPTETATAEPSPSPTSSSSPSSEPSPTPTIEPSPTPTSTPEPTSSPSPTPESSPQPTPSETPTATATPSSPTPPLNSVNGTTGEGGSLNLIAPIGKIFTNVIFASYGLPENYVINAQCHAANSVAKVSEVFLGQNNAVIQAINEIFGDPCGGIVKRLEVILEYGDANPATAPTPQPTPLPSPSPTPEPTATPSPTPSEPSPTPSPTPQPTSEPTASPSPSPEPSVTPTPQPEPTPQPSPSTTEPTPSPLPTPIPSQSPEPNPVPSPAPSPIDTPSVTPTPDPQPQPTPTPSPEPQPSPSPEVTPSPVPEPEPTPQPSEESQDEPSEPQEETDPTNQIPEPQPSTEPTQSEEESTPTEEESSEPTPSDDTSVPDEDEQNSDESETTTDEPVSDDQQSEEQSDSSQSESQEQENPSTEPLDTSEVLKDILQDGTVTSAEVKALVENANADGKLTEAEKEIVATAIIAQFIDAPAIPAEALKEAGLDFSDLPAETPVDVRTDEDGNAVIITAEVADALELLVSPAAIFQAIFESPAQLIFALGNLGADMSPEEREEATKTIIAATIVGNIATTTMATAIGGIGYRRPN